MLRLDFLIMDTHFYCSFNHGHPAVTLGELH